MFLCRLRHSKFPHDVLLKVLDAFATPIVKVVFAFREEKVRVFARHFRFQDLYLLQMFWKWLWALTMQPLPLWMASEIPQSSSSSSSSSSSPLPFPIYSSCKCRISPAYLYFTHHSTLNMAVELEEGSAWVLRFMVFFQV